TGVQTCALPISNTSDEGDSMTKVIISANTPYGAHVMIISTILSTISLAPLIKSLTPLTFSGETIIMATPNKIVKNMTCNILPLDEVAPKKFSDLNTSDEGDSMTKVIISANTPYGAHVMIISTILSTISLAPLIKSLTPLTFSGETIIMATPNKIVKNMTCNILPLDEAAPKKF